MPQISQEQPANIGFDTEEQAQIDLIREIEDQNLAQDVQNEIRYYRDYENPLKLLGVFGLQTVGPIEMRTEEDVLVHEQLIRASNEKRQRVANFTRSNRGSFSRHVTIMDDTPETPMDPNHYDAYAHRPEAIMQAYYEEGIEAAIQKLIRLRLAESDASYEVPSLNCILSLKEADESSIEAQLQTIAAELYNDGHTNYLATARIKKEAKLARNRPAKHKATRGRQKLPGYYQASKYKKGPEQPNSVKDSDPTIKPKALTKTQRDHSTVRAIVAIQPMKPTVSVEKRPIDETQGTEISRNLARQFRKTDKATLLDTVMANAMPGYERHENALGVEVRRVVAQHNQVEVKTPQVKQTSKGKPVSNTRIKSTTDQITIPKIAGERWLKPGLPQHIRAITTKSNGMIVTRVL